MTKTEYNRYSMYRTVSTVMTEYNTIVQKTQALSAAVVEFNGSIGVIERKDADYLNASKGTTVHKHYVRG